MSLAALRAVYSPELIALLPPRLGAVLRARLRRGFAHHPNRANPWAAALLGGALPPPPPPDLAARLTFVHADAAEYLERAPAGSFSGFSLSNILDGASEAYAARLFAALRHAAAPGAVAVLRSFREPGPGPEADLAAEDRALLWGSVRAAPVASL
jgi:hypothetical protein